MVEVGSVDAVPDASVLMLEACCVSAHNDLVACIAQGQNVNHVWPGGLRLLHVAASRGDVRSVKLLINAGANLDAVAGKGETAVSLAAAEGHQSIIKELHLAGANLNHPTRCGDTPLHAAMSGRHFDCARLLLWLGAQAKPHNKRGLTPEDMVPVADSPKDLADLFRVKNMRQLKFRAQVVTEVTGVIEDDTAPSECDPA